MRIIIDNSIWVRCLLRESFMDYVQDSLDGHVLLISDDLLAELLKKSVDPRLKSRYWDPYATELLGYIARKGTMIPVTTVIKACRDPNDDYLLALAFDGNADYLITGDKDLLDMGSFGETLIRPVDDLHLV